MKTVLIHAYECAPYHRPSSTIGAQRPYQFAKHLPKFGWRAIVLCCDFARRYSLEPGGKWEEQVKEEVTAALQSWDGCQSLIIPLPSLRYADAIDRMWLRAVEIDANGVFSSRPGIGSSISRKLATSIKYLRGDYSQSWQDVALFAAEVLQEEGISLDVQIAEHGPDAGIYVASRLYARHRIPWLIDFRDPVLQGKGRLAALMLKLHLRNISRTCRAIVNVTPVWTELDKLIFPDKPCVTIPNGYDEEEFQGFSHQTDPEHLRLFYFGGIKPGQSFQLLFDALNLLANEDPQYFERMDFSYYGYGTAEVSEEKEKFCPQLKCTIKGVIERRLVFEKAKQCDLLILLSKREKDQYLRSGFFPGKVFEYFGLEKPVVVIPSDKGLLDELMLETGAGVSFENPGILAAFLKECWIKKSRGDLPMNVNKSNLEKYTREFQSKQLSVLLS